MLIGHKMCVITLCTLKENEVRSFLRNQYSTETAEQIIFCDLFHTKVPVTTNRCFVYDRDSLNAPL